MEDVTEEEIDTDIPGKYTGKIKVIYPDGSSKTFRVEIRVKKRPGIASPSSASGRCSAGNDRIYSDPVPGLANGSRGGRWMLLDADRHKWIYDTSGNITPKNGWMFIENPYAKDMQGRFSWFMFNGEGIMEFGWIRGRNGKWYHTHDVSGGNLGVLEKGWKVVLS